MKKRTCIALSVLLSAACVVAGGTVGKASQIRLRVGVISDIHITSAAQQPYFEKSLRTLDKWGVDGVLVCGDLADHGLVQQLELVAESWFRVFPEGRGFDGREVVNLMHYGDHDMSSRFWNQETAKKAFPDEKLRRQGVLANRNHAADWERCFREPWLPIQHKKVKGYDFVLCHYTRAKDERGRYNDSNTPGLVDFFKEHAFDRSRPIFVSQHRPPKGTICGQQVIAAYNEDDGTSTSLYSQYPNLISFFGHLHRTATCEKSIWQGAFTCVHVPSLRYVCTRGGRENGYSIADRPAYAPSLPAKLMPSIPSGRTHQGLFMAVSDDEVVFRRWDFEHDKSLGPNWVVPIASFKLPDNEKPFSPDRRAEKLPVPKFPEDAVIRVENAQRVVRAKTKCDVRIVSFPPVGATPGSVRADDYEVTVELWHDDVVRTLCQKRVYSPRYFYGLDQETMRVECWFSKDEVPDGWMVRYVVRPSNAFGIKGDAIATQFSLAGGDNPTLE